VVSVFYVGRRWYRADHVSDRSVSDSCYFKSNIFHDEVFKKKKNKDLKLFEM